MKTWNNPIIEEVNIHETANPGKGKHNGTNDNPGKHKGWGPNNSTSGAPVVEVELDSIDSAS